ncbi:MAG: ATP synthase F1 subunit delta [Bacteroidales bacterium]
MDYSAIAVRYSKALFTLAKEKAKLDKINQDFSLIYDVYKTEPEFVRMIQFPVIQASKKAEIIYILFSGKIDQLTLDFLNLLFSKKREAHLQAIILYFQKLFKEEKGIKSVKFTTVSALSESVRFSIREILKTKYGNQIEIVEQTDPALIGGFVLRIEDEQYDASVVKHLENIKRSFKI